MRSIRLLFGLLFAVALHAQAPVSGCNAATTTAGATTSALTCSGATQFHLFETCGSGVHTTAPTDSSSNTWTARTERGVGSNFARLYFVQTATATNSHTFTSPANCVIAVAGFSGVTGATDGADIGAIQSATPQALTAITPTATGDLFIAGGFEPTATDATFLPCNNEAASTACTNPSFIYAQAARGSGTTTGLLSVLYWGLDTSTNALTTVWKLNNAFNGIVTHAAYLATAAASGSLTPAHSSAF